jgi:hypothetical protein
MIGEIEFQEILPAWLSPDHRDKRTVVTVHGAMFIK